MNLGTLLHNLSSENKLTIRKLEKLNRKISKCETAIIFNRQCIQEDILPKYSNIRLHDPAARKQKFTKEFRKNLVQLQLKNKEKNLEKLKGKVNQLYSMYA